MAAALYYLTIAAVILIGILAGRRARSTIQAMLFGLMGNLVMAATLFCATILFAVLFFVSTVVIGAVVQGMFDPWMLGVHFIVLLVVVPLGSAGVAVLEHRHLEKVEARRLPF